MTVRSSSTSPCTTSDPVIVRLERDRARLQVMAHGSEVDALPRQRGHVHRRARGALRALAYDAGLEHLVDGVVQAVGVREHDVVELAALRVGDRARLQRLEVEADRGDRRLQLVGDRVDEAVVLLVAADLHDQKHGVDDQPGDDQREQDDRR